MKKLIAAVILTLCTVGIVIAEDGLKLSGEMKTGFYWYMMGREGQEGIDQSAFIHNSEDTPWGDAPQTYYNYRLAQGRYRLNFQYDKGNIGTKFRFQTTTWPQSVNDTAGFLSFSYAFVYGYFFDDNLKISAGLMGDSPWGAGGPETWTELDTTVGVRLEFMPQFIPFIAPGSLNLGLVLNNFNGAVEEGAQAGVNKRTLGDLLNESVLGLSYTHDYFHVRVAYRLDSLVDGVTDGSELLFRLEERAIQKYLHGFQIWANGYYRFFRTAENVPDGMDAVNWLYAQYEHDLFITQVRMGYNIKKERHTLYARPNFFFKLFNNFLQIGAAFEYAADAGDVKLDKNAPYLHWFIEPQIRLNLTSNSYIALVYRYYNDYEFYNYDPSVDGCVNTQVHWINLRAVFTF